MNQTYQILKLIAFWIMHIICTSVRKIYSRYKVGVKITSLLLEIFAICGIAFLFICNRHDHQIFSTWLNVICIGIAYTLLSIILSSEKIQYNVRRFMIIGFVIILIMGLAVILAFFVNLENKEESNNFYIYFFHDEDKNALVDIEKDYNRMWLFMSDYFNKSISKDKNLDNSIKVDVNFFKDFLEFLIIQNMGFRYESHWIIFIDNLPLFGTVSGPKDYEIPKITVGKNEIIGHEQNSLINRVEVSMWGDEKINVPENTFILLEKGIETDLLPKMDYSEETKNRTRRLTIKNGYCKISLETYFYGIFPMPINNFETKIMTLGFDKSNIQVYALKQSIKLNINDSKWVQRNSLIITNRG